MPSGPSFPHSTGPVSQGYSTESVCTWLYWCNDVKSARLGPWLYSSSGWKRLRCRGSVMGTSSPYPAKWYSYGRRSLDTERSGLISKGTKETSFNLWNISLISLFIVSACAGSCAGAARVSSQDVVDFFPELLCCYLPNHTHTHTEL